MSPEELETVPTAELLSELKRRHGPQRRLPNLKDISTNFKRFDAFRTYANFSCNKVEV